MSTAPTAAVLIVGNEILSGRTKDANLSYIANWLTDRGVDVMEARTIPDDEATIVRHVNELRAAHTYLFTTGGIGPTHDDITADCVAKAFGVEISENAEAVAILEAHYEPGEFTAPRRRMARIPHGASLIDNPVSRAPGFRMENVFVMAGVPVIMQAMLESIAHQIVGGAPVQSVAVAAMLAESKLAEGLERVDNAHESVSIGCYPYYNQGEYGASVILRGRDSAVLQQAAEQVRQIIRDLGATPLDRDLAAPQKEAH